MRDLLDGQTSLGALQIRLLQADLEVLAEAATRNNASGGGRGTGGGEGADGEEREGMGRLRSSSLDENSKRRGLIRVRSRRGTTRMSAEEARVPHTTKTPAFIYVQRSAKQQAQQPSRALHPIAGLPTKMPPCD